MVWRRAQGAAARGRRWGSGGWSGRGRGAGGRALVSAAAATTAAAVRIYFGVGRNRAGGAERRGVRTGAFDEAPAAASNSRVFAGWKARNSMRAGRFLRGSTDIAAGGAPGRRRETPAMRGGVALRARLLANGGGTGGLRTRVMGHDVCSRRVGRLLVGWRRVGTVCFSAARLYPYRCRSHGDFALLAQTF